MSNFSIKIDLSKLQGFAVSDLQTPGGVQRCAIIPIQDNNIFEGQKGCYLDLVAFEMQNPKYEATHAIKPSIPKSIRDVMTEEQRKTLPIVGDLKPLGGAAQSQAQQPPYNPYAGRTTQYAQPQAQQTPPPPAYGGGNNAPKKDLPF